ncbi:MAG: SOS response-associated peptidase [Balneolaceae bacterium]|nr:SOS response-associated peptidase [Balneolaceae bacterium]
MCGRYQLYASKEELEKEYRANAEKMGELDPSYNVAPRQQQPAALVGEGHQRLLYKLRWGLVPHFYDDPDDGPRPINARSETVDEKPMFRRLFETRRCLVPTNGFYEWDKQQGTSQPYRIHFRDREIMTMAGIYDVWENEEGKKLPTFTILTTSPNEKVEKLHSRMPVILHPDRYDDWLNPDYGDYVELKRWCVEPYPADELEIYPVAKKVGNVRNDSPELIERRDDAIRDQQQLF